jgi:hypothetical protein
LIETAYRSGEALGLPTWCHDQAGPFQTVPYPGSSWQPEDQPARQPSEYIRNGTAKLLTLFHPATGQVRVKGVTNCPNSVLPPWLKQELSTILASLPEPSCGLDAAARRAVWESWQAGLSIRFTLPSELPALRMLLVLDNLTGHKSPDLVLWFVKQGIMPLYTPLAGSWLNMAESIQRIIQRRALDGQQPSTPRDIIDWLEHTAQAWNRQPTPFVWGGPRAHRRARSRQRRHALPGSGGQTRRPIRRHPTIIEKWRNSCQTTH